MLSVFKLNHILQKVFIVKVYKFKSMKKIVEIITEKRFFKELKIAVPEMTLYDRPFVHNTLGLLCSFTKELVESAPATRIERIKSGQEDILMRIGLFLNRCWFEGTSSVMNAVMVSYFESTDKKTYLAIRPYIILSLDKEARRYLKWWRGKR